MKTSIKLIACLLSCFAFAQTNNSTSSLTNNTNRALQDVSSSNNIQSYGASVFVNPAKYIDGSIYLFKEWKNHAKIVSVDNDVFSLNNINFNIEQQVFQSKISEDSIFTFGFKNISKFIVSGKTFKPINGDKGRKIYEVISESKDFTILKDFKLDIIEGSSNPMVNRKNDKYKTKEAYFIKKNNSVLPFKFKKKNFLSLLKDNNENVVAFAKERKLSFSNEEDAKKIMQYYNTL